MEVLVVTRYYDYYEDSYKKILGVCTSEEKADELIEIDKTKYDHPKMNKNDWFHFEDATYRETNKLINDEINSPKNGGFLKKFNYDNLGKRRKNLYDILKEKYDGVNLNSSVYNEMSEENKFILIKFLVPYYDKLTFEEYKEIEDYYLSGVPSENPENIYYKKEKFELL